MFEYIKVSEQEREELLSERKRLVALRAELVIQANVSKNAYAEKCRITIMAKKGQK